MIEKELKITQNHVDDKWFYVPWQEWFLNTHTLVKLYYVYLESRNDG